MAGLFTPEIRDDAEAQTRVRTWVDALRSGKYAQGRSALRRGDAFCCLGVACDLERDTLGGWEFAEPPKPQFIAGTDGYMPEDATSLYYIATIEGVFWDGPNGESLASLNDAGATFAEIAEIVERELAEVLA